MIYFCCDQFRRAAIGGSALNGIDFVEVVDRDAPSEDMRQRILHVHLVNDPGAGPDPRQHPLRGRRAHPRHPRRCGDDGPRPTDQRGGGRGRPLRRRVALSPAAGPLAHRRPAPGGLRPDALPGHLLVQGRVPVALRLQARLRLPLGATRATLDGHFPDLRVGETLIFEEIVGPRTGRRADADPAHWRRCGSQQSRRSTRARR